MSETSTRSGQPWHSMAVTSVGEPGEPGQPGRRRRGMRIALIAVGSVFALVAVIAVAGLVTLNHIASEIKRVPVHFAKLTAYDHYAGLAGGGTNVLLTSSVRQPRVRGGSDLITILHINADHQAGGVVAISPDVVAAVPGHGRLPLGEAQAVGGPSLLVSAVQQVTGVRLSHYASLDFSHVARVVNTAGGVNVTVPFATTAGRYAFHAGVNHLNGAQVLAYTSRPGLSSVDHVLRQQVVLRAILRKIANAHLLTNPVSTVNMLSALTSMLTVDSNFTNSGLAALAAELKGLSSRAGTFLTAPEHLSGGHQVLNAGVSDKLWTAINDDNLAALARQYPSTVTPATAP
jgi:LCP family protein required for cell wall assembly